MHATRFQEWGEETDTWPGDLLGAPKIVVADGDAEALEIVAKTLAGAGYDVLTAASGLDARSLIDVIVDDNAETVGILVLDADLPDTPCLDLAAEARRHSALVIVLAANPSDALMLGARELGVPVLQKPARPDVLRRSVLTQLALAATTRRKLPRHVPLHPPRGGS